MSVEIKDTNITMTGHSDRQIAIQKLAEAIKTLAEALKEPDGANYGIYLGHVEADKPKPKRGRK